MAYRFDVSVTDVATVEVCQAFSGIEDLFKTCLGRDRREELR